MIVVVIVIVKGKEIVMVSLLEIQNVRLMGIEIIIVIVIVMKKIRIVSIILVVVFVIVTLIEIIIVVSKKQSNFNNDIFCF